MTSGPRLFVTLTFCIAASCLQAQPAFEVASVKPSGTGYQGITTGQNGSFRAIGVTLKALVAWAYGVPEFRVEGGPGWAGSQLWDIDARTNVAGQPIEPPLRALLEQRFNLRATNESKEGNVFFLDIAKSGVKMRQTTSAEQPRINYSSFFISSPALTVPLLEGVLTRHLGSPVINRTGLTAAYEVYITWTPEVGEGDPGLIGAKPPLEAKIDQRSIFAALEEDLGLKLTSGKSETPLVTILSADRPGGN